MSKKRLFQVFDEMNVNDEKNNTAHLGCCYAMVEAKTAKGGGHVTMGVPAEAITRMLLDEVQPILILKRISRPSTEVNRFTFRSIQMAYRR